MEPPTKPGIERRREPRQVVKDVVLVKLSFGNDAEPITCFVWDISRGGMRLKLPTKMALPALVYVTVDNVRRPARVAWTDYDQIGLEFLPADPNARAGK
jgi:hypothetical protein